MPPASQSRLYNPRHPERTLLYETAAEHCATRLELANVGQFDGQGEYRTPSPIFAKRLPSIWKAASSPTALHAPSALTARMTTSWPSPAQARACAPRATPVGWWRPQRTCPIPSSPARRCASGFCVCPSGCATSCSAMARCSTGCCASSCG